MAIAAAAYLNAQGYLPSPLQDVLAILTTCPHRALSGTPCPLCGATTAARLLLETRWTDAYTANPTAVFLSPLFLLQLGYRVYRLYCPRWSWFEEGLILVLGIFFGMGLWIWLV